MNKVILIGRMTKDPETKTTASQVAFCGFTLAVDRKYKSKDGERQADFLPCVAWRQQAEFIGKYFVRGSRICITGSVQSRTYDDANGTKHYVVEVMVEDAEFIDNKKSDESNYSKPPASSQDDINKKLPELDNGFYDDALSTALPYDL
jgi:single-strand DNA-binding protein